MPALWRRHAVPLAVLGGVFLVSRAAAFAAGVRFDITPLFYFWQYPDVRLLQHDLLQTLWNLHSQPPLYSAWLGVNLKLFGASHGGSAIHFQYVLCGLALSLLLYALVVRVTGRRLVALVAAALFTVSPAMLLYENWLFYEFPTTAMIVATVLAFDMFARRRTFAWGSVFFVLVAVLVYMRSTFQLPWVVLVLALALWLMPGARRLVLAAAAVPVLVVVLLYVKNEVVFGVPTTSSWAGMNLAQVAYHDLSPATRRQLIADGTLSKTALIKPFQTLDKYPDFVRKTKKTGIPSLDEVRKDIHLDPESKTNVPLSWNNNYNNLAYIAISNRYMHDALALIRARPGIYLDGVGSGIRLFFEPSSAVLPDYGATTNPGRIARWESIFDAVVLLRIRSLSVVCWTLVLAYLLAIGYGCVLTRRLFKRRKLGEPDERLPLLAMVWLTLLYLLVVTTFGEVWENERIRFALDPLALALDAAAARELIPWARRALANGRTTHLHARALED